MSNKISPFAIKFPQIPAIAGVELFTAHSGMRYSKHDIFFAKFTDGANVGGLLTSNTMPGEPVIWCREILPHGKAKALVVNSGYSNVLTGEAGKTTIKKTVQKAIELTGCKADEVYIASTGIIGQPVNDDLLIEALDKKLGKAGFEQATIAINTTDTFSKGVFVEAKIGGTKVSIAGIIKGSGMIAPDMATMLGFLFTDAAISSKVLQQLMAEIVDKTYHAITVDSDTSTSDAVLAFATGKAGNNEITDINAPEFQDFRAKFLEANLELAKLVVKDGEGATKFVTIEITGAENDKAAKNIGLSIANSPLVKTAIAGQDPNWGRIAGAIGKAGEKVNKDKTNIWLGVNQVCKNGALSADYNEAACQEHMKQPNIIIKAEVGIANGKSTVYTIDLTHGYIEINADYRS